MLSSVPSFPAIMLMVFTALPLRALEIGAGYNEQIGDIHTPSLARSGVKWVRAYVNIPRNFLTYAKVANPSPNPPPNPFIYSINGVVEGNLIEDPDHVSSDADVLSIAAVDNLINAKNVRAGGQPLKVILGLKQDFTYPYPASHDPKQQGRVPDPNTASGLAELDHMISAIEDLLSTNNRGAWIDLLVLGNEPMFEVQPNNDTATAANYAAYLHLLANRIATLRASPPNGAAPWGFKIHVGALNRPSAPTPVDNKIVDAVLEVARTNPHVDGVDLHEHLANPLDLQADITYVLDRIRPEQQLSCTEFSIVALLEANLGTTLGNWGPANGYGPESKDWTMWQWVNRLIQQAATGRAISAWRFQSFFHSRTWYPRNWFRTMVTTFALPQNRVSVITYGLEQTSRFPWQENQINGTSTPWVLNALYNPTLLGVDWSGNPATNPLIGSDFQWAVWRYNR